MSPIASVNSLFADTYNLTSAPSKQTPKPAAESVPVDQVDISHPDKAALRDTSETGRIALNLAAGRLTSDQATQLYQQVAAIHTQIQADKQADGGALSQQDAQAIDQLQSQLSDTIYSDAHNGATPPTTESDAEKRMALQAGRIQLDAQSGKIDSTQAQALTQQQSKIDHLIASDLQAGGGTLTQAQAQQINQLQDQASRQIYQATHGPASPNQ